jgi:glutaminyl-tRNA synthetase
MKAGKYKDGEHILRAKMSEDAMSSPNMTNRDPALYRIRHAHHHRTGDDWCIYPMYDFTHPLSDAMESVTHSICTLEFQDHRPFYDWLIATATAGGFFQPPVPRQYEMSRLNLSYVVMSKGNWSTRKSCPAGTIRACRRSSACAAAATRRNRSSCSASASASRRRTAGST